VNLRTEQLGYITSAHGVKTKFTSVCTPCSSIWCYQYEV